MSCLAIQCQMRTRPSLIRVGHTSRGHTLRPLESNVQLKTSVLMLMPLQQSVKESLARKSLRLPMVMVEVFGKLVRMRLLCQMEHGKGEACIEESSPSTSKYVANCSNF